MFRALRNGWRLLRMALRFARHDALFPLETLGIAPALIAWARLFALRRDSRRPGERLAEALQEMGPSFIKLGQALSTRADLLSEGVAADLARLQDHSAKRIDELLPWNWKRPPSLGKRPWHCIRPVRAAL